MAAEANAPKCERCGAGGELVLFGETREYHYHCLSCWKQVAEQVVADFALRAEGES